MSLRSKEWWVATVSSYYEALKFARHFKFFETKMFCTVQLHGTGSNFDSICSRILEGTGSWIMDPKTPISIALESKKGSQDFTLKIFKNLRIKMKTFSKITSSKKIAKVSLTVKNVRLYFWLVVSQTSNIIYQVQ